MIDAETIVNARWVLPVAPPEAVLGHHSVVIDNGVIVAVEPTARAIKKYRAKEIIDLSNHAVIPGLVNSHTHAAMTLLRGYADDLPLEAWLNDYIWPAEAKWIDAPFIRAGMRLALAEMLRGGTTCFNDMYFFPDIVAECVEEAGSRASVGMIVIDFPTVWARDADEYLEKGLAVHDRFRHASRIVTAFAPHAPYTVSDGPLERIGVLAEELDLQIHMHVHETAHEVEEATSRLGMRPLERLDQLQLVSPRLQAVHATQLLDAEIDLLAVRGAHVVHCPESNQKLASGACPVKRLLGAGVNIALGTDSAASNDDLDMLGETRSAALFAKSASGDPTALPAHLALAAATLSGARALGIEQNVGSIEPGKAADLVAVDLRAPSTQPVYDPMDSVVYSASRDQVSDVWVAGRRLLENGRLTTLDLEAVLAEAVEWGERISAAR